MATIIDSTGTPASESSALSVVNVTLDIKQNKLVSVLLKQYNNQGQQIKFTVTDDGEKIELKEIEHTVLFKMMTPDGRRISSYCAINENDHTAVLTVAKNYCSYPGKGTAELEVMDALEESQVGTMNINIIIENSVYPDEMINGSSTYQGLDEKINAVREVCNSAIIVKEETESIRDETETIHDECVDLNNQTAQNTQLANDYANMAQSYANGESGAREGEETDNAKYYYNQTSLLKTDTETIKTELLEVQEVVNQKASAAESYATNASNFATEAENSASQTSIDRETVTALANEVNNKIGSPLTASTSSDMINQNKIYVYTGSEDGYTFGNWYYYDGSSWVSGGIYNSMAFKTDTSLTYEGEAADAKATGDQISSLKEDLDYYKPKIGRNKIGRLIAGIVLNVLGEEIGNPAFNTTEFIDVRNDKNIYLTLNSELFKFYRVLLYDEKKNVLQGYMDDSDYNNPIQNNNEYAYIRLSMYKTQIDGAMVSTSMIPYEQVKYTFPENIYIDDKYIKLGYVNAVSYGVDNTGDTDVTEKINELLTKYNNVYLPAGTYSVSKIVIKSGFKIIGDGETKTILKRKQSTEKYNGVIEVPTGETYYYIANLSIDCNYQYSYGILLREQSNVYDNVAHIENIECYKSMTDGIRVNDRNRLDMRNIRSFECDGKGLNFLSRDCVLNNVTTWLTGEEGIYLKYNNTLIGGKIYHANLNASGLETSTPSALVLDSYNDVSCFRVEENPFTGIKFLGINNKFSGVLSCCGRINNEIGNQDGTKHCSLVCFKASYNVIDALLIKDMLVDSPDSVRYYADVDNEVIVGCKLNFNNAKLNRSMYSFADYFKDNERVHFTNILNIGGKKVNLYPVYNYNLTEVTFTESNLSTVEKTTNKISVKFNGLVEENAKLCRITLPVLKTNDTNRFFSLTQNNKQNGLIVRYGGIKEDGSEIESNIFSQATGIQFVDIGIKNEEIVAFYIDFYNNDEQKTVDAEFLISDFEYS